MGKKILLIGTGGHCHSVLDTLLRSAAYDQIGVVVRDQEGLIEIQNDPLLKEYTVGTDDDLKDLKNSGWEEAFITVGSVGATKQRRRIYRMLKEIGFFIPVIADPSAMIAVNANAEEGCFIGKLAIVNAGARIGANSIINSAAVVEHDCTIGAFSHISPGAVLCGEVCVGDDTHIGAGTTVIQQVHIGNNTLIGAGSTVIKDIGDNMLAYGNPCRAAEKRDGE